MSNIHKTTLRDRIKAAIRALKGKPCNSITYGISVKPCTDCRAVITNIETFAVEQFMAHGFDNMEEYYKKQMAKQIGLDLLKNGFLAIEKREVPPIGSQWGDEHSLRLSVKVLRPEKEDATT